MSLTETLLSLPTDDPFWQRMRAMWAIPRSAGHASDGGAASLAELRKLREEWDEHQRQTERVQDECRTMPEEPRP
jgi:hypothetical protein